MIRPRPWWLFLALTFALPLFGQEPAAKDYSGFYEVRGTEKSVEGSTNYVSILMMKKINKDQYVAQWTTGIGSNITGVGFLDDDKLTFSWITAGGTVGITQYTLGPKNKHEGKWCHTKNLIWSSEVIEFRMPFFKAAKENSDASAKRD